MSLFEDARVHSWVSRVHLGDAAALNELLTHFERRLRSLTRKMIREYPLVHLCEQTDDVFQRAVLRLCRGLKSLSPASPEDLLRLAAAQVRRELSNLARHYRSRPRMQGLGYSSPESALARSADDGRYRPHRVDGVGSRQLDRWTDFHEVAAALPEKDREVFDLIWYQGMSQQQVAELLGVCVRTVKSRWQAARLTIADALDGQLPEV
jgi:RNA polymerase sigma factor (sigma-70 family)